MDLLEIENLTVAFPYQGDWVKVVRGINLEVAKGEIVGVLGESGSGKTVSSTSIVGLVKDNNGRIEEGRILFKGEDLLQYKEKELRKIRGKQIAYIFQDPVGSLNPYRRIGRQLKEVLKVHGLPYDNVTISSLLKDVGLTEGELICNMYPSQLSGGQCQRVMIAMAIACRPELLIADEPISAIDASLQKKILELLQAINRKYGTSILIITHDFAVAKYLCHRVVIMYGGLVLEQGPIHQVLQTPFHPYTQELLKCVQSLAGNDDVLYTLEGRTPTALELGQGCPFHYRCKLKTEQCQKELPQLTEVLSGRQARCWQVAL